MTDITVTDVGSNSGVLGRSGSGGLGGAAAGLGSSFFFGAIVDGSQETKGGINRRGGSSKLLVECRPLYPPSTGISTPPAVANQTANNREETIKGYAFVLLFKTMDIVRVCMCVCMHRQDKDIAERYWLNSLAEVHGDQSISIRQPISSLSSRFFKCWPSSVKWTEMLRVKMMIAAQRGCGQSCSVYGVKSGCQMVNWWLLINPDVDGIWYFSQTMHPNLAIIRTSSHLKQNPQTAAFGWQHCKSCVTHKNGRLVFFF